MRYNKDEFENCNYKDLVSVSCDNCNAVFGKKYSFVKFALKHKSDAKCFCSVECKLQFKTRKRIDEICCECGSTFQKPEVGCDSTQRFCSKSCAATANNRNRPKKEQKVSTRKRVCGVFELSCKECSKLFYVKHYLKHQRKFCSKTCAGKNNYHPNTTKATKCLYRGIKLDSGAELAFAQLLDKHQVDWVKNQDKFFKFKDKDSRERKYFPDFYLPKYNFWVEIKGKRYVREDDPLRLAAVGNIELIMSNNIRLPKCCN